MTNNCFKVKDFYCEISENDNIPKDRVQVDIYIKNNEEKEKVKDFLLYKNQSQEELKENIERLLCSKIGKVLDDGTVKKEFFRQGWIYKDFEKFYKHEGICYVAESDENNINDSGISFQGIYEEVCEYLLLSGVDCEKVPQQIINEMVEDIFDAVDWQNTYSLINEDYLGEYIENFPDEYFLNYEKNKSEENEL